MGAKFGHIVTAATRAKISAAQRGRPKPKASEALRGRKQTAEHIRNRVEGRAGYQHSEATKRKIGAANSIALRGRKNGPRSEETKQKISAARKGKKPSPEATQKMREAGRRRHARDPMFYVRFAAAGRKAIGPTKLERALYRLLDGAGLEFTPEVVRGVYRVDAYVPSRNLVFEADGSWGHNPQKDAVRDQYLVRGGVVAVVRLTEQDLRPFMEKQN